jgi:type I restriction enzyme S subunit
MSEWKNIKIKDLGKVITGNTPPRKSPELYGNHTPFVKPTDIDVGARYCFKPEECYSELGYKKYTNSLIPKGATCVVTIGSIGQKIIKAHTDLFINQAMNAVIPSEEYDESFVFYLLKLNLPLLSLYDSGTASGRENVSKSSFSNIDLVILKSKKTQQKIAAILSAYDDLIENNLKQIKLLEEMAQITYEEWFVRLKFPNHENTPVDGVTGLPLGWEYKTLDDIFDFSNGYAFYTVGYSDNGYDVIDLGNISTSSDLIISGKEKKVSEDLYNKLSKFQLNKYDVVIAMTDMTKELGILAKTAIIDIDNKYVLNQRVGRIRSKSSTFSYSFIYAVLNDNRFILTMQSKIKGSVQFYVNTKDITNYQVLIPTNDLISEFQKEYQPLLEARLKLKEENQLLKEARDILLPRLMTGKIAV